MRSLGALSYGLGQDIFQSLWMGIAQIPVAGNAKKRASTDALLLASVVAFLQKFICSTNENVPGEQMGAKLDSICRESRVVFFEARGHL